MINFDEDKQNQKLNALLKKEEEELLQTLSTKYKVKYIDLQMFPINMDALRLIPEKTARENKMAGFNKIGKRLQVAVTSPNSPSSNAVIEDLKMKGFDVEVFMSPTSSLEKAWGLYKDLSFATESKAGAFEISNDDIQEMLSTMKNLQEVKEKLTEIMKVKKSLKVSRIVEIILAGALSLKASDIHLEPEESYVRLRYRLDGVLNDIHEIDQQTYTLILSRIKLISGLKLNVRTTAQDGRFSIKLEDADIEIRTSILPGAYNESIVLRVLNPKSINVSLDSMGIPKKLFDILMREIQKPNGMLLTTGPTGSGKTTTLYSFLKKVHTPDIKIITIEDPIEYHLEGLVQTQTNKEKGYTFASGLRSVLRQDPDVIMVGEIRDGETASIAINAALTGHLVFSTLHTNTAAGAFPRLIDLGINPKVITSAVNVAMAQRLVRKLCPECRKEVPLEGRQKEIVDKVISTVPQDERPSNIANMWVPGACEACNNTGYKGRVGIFEAVIADSTVESIILNNPSESEIKKAASGQGILDMEQDGITKILEGVTSFEELERVIELV